MIRDAKEKMRPDLMPNTRAARALGKRVIIRVADVKAKRA